MYRRIRDLRTDNDMTQSELAKLFRYVTDGVQ